MDTLSTVWAELHQEELLREAAARRRARPASYPNATTNTTGSGLIDRLRSALAPVSRPAQSDCPECA